MSEKEIALPFSLVTGSLIGETDAENVRHMLVRVAFTNEFRHDERVEACCYKWGARYGVEPVAIALVETLEALAEATGTTNRAVLMERMSQLNVAEDGRAVTVDSSDVEGIRFATALSENQHQIDRANELADQRWLH